MPDGMSVVAKELTGLDSPNRPNRPNFNISREGERVIANIWNTTLGGLHAYELATQLRAEGIELNSKLIEELRDEKKMVTIKDGVWRPTQDAVDFMLSPRQARTLTP